VPVLGVCLGHQALAHVHGGQVVKAPEPVHGRLSTLRHSEHPLMQGIPSGVGQGFDVVRYHSLMVDPSSLPECLEPIAWTCCGHHAVHLDHDQPSTPPLHNSAASSSAGCSAYTASGTPPGAFSPGMDIIMALAHRTCPHFGVQFHPESVSTRHGIALLSNFCRLALHVNGSAGVPRLLPNMVGPPGSAHAVRPWPTPEHARGAALRLAWERLPGLLGQLPGGMMGAGEFVFASLFGFSEDSFWLDSSSAPDRGRFSYMGGRGGRLWRRITYRLPAAEECAGMPAATHMPPRPGTVEQEDWRGEVTTTRTCFLPFLSELLERNRLCVSEAEVMQLPFNFWGGLVGYLGFELKAECGGRAAHVSPTPDAAFLLSDRVLAIDHLQGDVYVLSMFSGDGAGGDGEAEAHTWLDSTAVQLRGLIGAHGINASGDASNACEAAVPRGGSQHVAASAKDCPQPVKTAAGNGAAVAPKISSAEPFRLRHTRDQYMANIEVYRQALYDGESYEVRMHARCRTVVP